MPLKAAFSFSAYLLLLVIGQSVQLKMKLHQFYTSQQSQLAAQKKALPIGKNNPPELNVPEDFQNHTL